MVITYIILEVPLISLINICIHTMHTRMYAHTVCISKQHISLWLFQVTSALFIPPSFPSIRIVLPPFS